MLMSQTGTIFHESMLLGEDCFFEEPRWKALMLSISKPKTSGKAIMTPECYPMISSLWIHASPTPRFFRQTTAIIVGTEASDPGTIFQLLIEIYQTRQNLVQWRKTFSIFAAERYTERHRLRLRELLGVSLAVQTVLNRLVVALEPRAAEASGYENETQAFAGQIISLCSEAAAEALPTSDLLLAQKLVVARAARESEHNWKLEISRGPIYGVERRTCVSVALFDRWCTSLGRREAISE